MPKKFPENLSLGKTIPGTPSELPITEIDAFEEGFNIDRSVDGFLGFLVFNESSLRELLLQQMEKIPKQRFFRFNVKEFQDLVKSYVQAEIRRYHEKTFSEKENIIKQKPFFKGKGSQGKLILSGPKLSNKVLKDLLGLYVKTHTNKLISELMNGKYILLIPKSNQYQIQPSFINSFLDKWNQSNNQQ